MNSKLTVELVRTKIECENQMNIKQNESTTKSM